MPGHVLIVDLFGLALAVTGFCMAFRQSFVRRLIGRPPQPDRDGSEDPLTHILRIAGVMVMVFGVVLSGMVTLFNLG